ncbi:hypothetical protein ACSSS7_003152 [Eimeria intestinalis]
MAKRALEARPAPGRETARRRTSERRRRRRRARATPWPEARGPLGLNACQKHAPSQARSYEQKKTQKAPASGAARVAPVGWRRDAAAWAVCGAGLKRASRWAQARAKSSPRAWARSEEKKTQKAPVSRAARGGRRAPERRRRAAFSVGY